MKYFDLTHELTEDTIPFPGDDPPKLFQDRSLKKDFFNSYRAEFGTHLGTHIDTPMHLTGSRKFISEYTPDRFCGDACVIDARGYESVQWQPEFGELILDCSIVLVCTGHSTIWGTPEYFESFPELTSSFADELKARNISMVGLDTPSPDKSPFTVHKQLLDDGIMILENLTNLEQIAGKTIRLYAFPLKLRADSCWVRAIAEEK